MTDATRRRLTAVTALVFVAAVVLVLGAPIDVVSPPADEAPPKGPEDVKLVSATEGTDARLWPFTSRQKRFETLTLPINLAVTAPPSQVRTTLARPTGVDWDGTNGTWRGADAPVDAGGPWYDARGATRYTYVSTPSPRTGGWQDEAGELQAGHYFGTRYHLRLYRVGRGGNSWTAIQAHHEYWDWFRLRHTVGSTARAKQYVERGLSHRQSVRAVDRQRFANGGISDADGWATVVDLTAGPRRAAATALPALAVLVGLAGAGSLRRRWASRDALPGGRDTVRLLSLFAVLALLPLAIRHGAIAVERAVPTVPPKLVAGAFYPVLAVGPPLAAIHWGRHLRPHRGGVVAMAGFGTGLFADYALLHLAVVPLSVLLHHLVALAALGAVAAADDPARSGDNGSFTPRRTWSLLAWFGTLAWPLLLGY